MKQYKIILLMLSLICIHNSYAACSAEYYKQVSNEAIDAFNMNKGVLTVNQMLNLKIGKDIFTLNNENIDFSKSDFEAFRRLLEFVILNRDKSEIRYMLTNLLVLIIKHYPDFSYIEYTFNHKREFK